MTSKVMDCVILIDIAIFGNLNVNLCKNKIRGQKKSPTVIFLKTLFAPRGDS